ncbi:MAG: hypothetical protein PUB29_02385 [Bacteroidales bacterium]|nr:hypothetical protein [Bacteroidales bacterium]
MNKNRTELDRIFEQGVSEVSRAPRKKLSDEQIKTAAVTSKSGAGVWLLAHAREMLIGVVSFVTGCFVTFAVLHYTVPKPSEPQTGENVNVDTIALPSESERVVVETFHETSLQNEDHSVPSSANPTSNNTRHTSHLQTPESQVQTPESQEPVVVKKTVVQRDTVHVKETVVVKDTVYMLNEE